MRSKVTACAILLSGILCSCGGEYRTECYPVSLPNRMEFVVRDMYHVDVMRCGINNKDIRVIKVMRIDMEKIKMGSIVNGTDGVRFEIGNSLIDIQDCLRINGIRIEFSESIELVITQ